MRTKILTLTLALIIGMYAVLMVALVTHLNAFEESLTEYVSKTVRR